MMVMVDNTLYQSAGEVSTVDGRCGNMDGEITSQTENGHGRANRERPVQLRHGRYGYQWIVFDGIHIADGLIDNQWIVFKPISPTSKTASQMFRPKTTSLFKALFSLTTIYVSATRTGWNFINSDV